MAVGATPDMCTSHSLAIMTPTWHFGTPRIPGRSVVLSAAALSVPVLAQVGFADTAGEHELLLWLLAVLPAFLLAYYRGWRGAATALAAGMAVLSLTQALLLATGSGTEDTLLLLGVVTAFILLSLTGGWFMERLHTQRRDAELLALTDDLTGLPNRRHAHMVLEPMFQQADSPRDLAVVFFDLDRFKDYNDRYGHASGDDALAAFGRLLGEATPAEGFSCRYGGEEFVTVLPGSGEEGGIAFAQRIREALAGQEGLLEPITVSAGVAAYAPGMHSRGELMAAADAALFVAKQSGRDAIRVRGTRPGTAEPLAAPGI